MLFLLNFLFFLGSSEFSDLRLTALSPRRVGLLAEYPRFAGLEYHLHETGSSPRTWEWGEPGDTPRALK
jgi:hypothetical protein